MPRRPRVFGLLALTALAGFERSFSVRQIDGYVYPNSLVGTNPPDYAGSLDGATVTVTDEALATGFGYLDGTFRFEGSPGGGLSYGFLANPLPNTAKIGRAHV